jgi:hypothetical protein
MVAAVAFALTLAPRGVAAAPVVRPPRGASHLAFGEIARLVTHAGFVLRLRSGKTVNVDATAAAASGRFSEPLYVGKPVVVKGQFDARGTLYAQSVTRMTRVDDRTPPDR